MATRSRLQPVADWDVLRRPPDFSLVLGGPLFQLMRRFHLTDDALLMLRRRLLAVVLLAWFPLLLLSTAGGELWAGHAAVPFLKDADVHMRFLISLPLLILAELVVHKRMRPLIQQFLERKLISANDLPRFDAAVTSAVRLRNSVLAELVLVALVYTVGIGIVWRNFVALDAATWYAVPSATGPALTGAGLWYGYVSLPVFQFLLLRWYYRLFIWVRFLWQVSRIRLNLIPTHPDRVGGLSFVSGQVYAFAVLAVAHGALLAGNLANRIFFMGANLLQYKAEIAVVVLFMLGLFLGPLLVFAPQLAEVKRIGLREYGTLSERYVREFDAKWLRGGAPASEALVGSGDIQSLADLGNSYAVVQDMRIVPVTRDALLRLVAATVAPVLPLALTLMSLEELLKKLVGILF